MVATLTTTFVGIVSTRAELKPIHSIITIKLFKRSDLVAEIEGLAVVWL